jgi:hypothetical protein
LTTARRPHSEFVAGVRISAPACETNRTNPSTSSTLNPILVAELRFGVLNHRPYNLGWGHHHCNVVVKDSGILETLDWMSQVLNRNIQEGHLPAAKRAS